MSHCSSVMLQLDRTLERLHDWRLVTSCFTCSCFRKSFQIDTLNFLNSISRLVYESEEGGMSWQEHHHHMSNLAYAELGCASCNQASTNYRLVFDTSLRLLENNLSVRKHRRMLGMMDCKLVYFRIPCWGKQVYFRKVPQVQLNQHILKYPANCTCWVCMLDLCLVLDSSQYLNDQA